jgi:hypothetical protein
MITKKVCVPECQEHNGSKSIDVIVKWICPTCGGPRGEVTAAISYDGNKRLSCDGWINPCGHVDLYTDVIKESQNNGLNQQE